MNGDPVARLLLAIEKRARRPLGALGLALIAFSLLAWLWTGDWINAVQAIPAAMVVAAADPKEPPRV